VRNTNLLLNVASLRRKSVPRFGRSLATSGVHRWNAEYERRASIHEGIQRCKTWAVT